MNFLGNVLKKIEDALHIGGCISLIGVAVLINADIVLRLLFNTPVQIQFEVTELYLMPALATLSLSRVFRDGGHLALDFIPERLPGLTGTVIAKSRLLLSAAFFAAVTYMSGKFALRALMHGDVEYGFFDWPLGWAYAVIPIGCGLLVLRLIYDALEKSDNCQTTVNTTKNTVKNKRKEYHMKTTNKLITGLVSVLALGLGAASVHAETLRLGDFQSTSHIVSVEGTTKWMAAVTEATNGAITFEHFPSQQAAKSAAQLDAVNNGILDASLIGALYHSEVLPLNSVVGLPGFYSSAVQGTKAIQTMLGEGPLRDEFLAFGVTPIFGFVLPPYQVLAKKHLGMPADWDALDLRTSGSTQAMTARALGAVGISIPGPEVYIAVERGRLDAVLFPLASVPGYKLNEVVSHISTNGSFGGYSFVMVVRTELFDGLPADVQATMISLGRETATHVAQAQDDSVIKLIAEWKDQGIETYSFTGDELEALRTGMELVSTDWLKRIDGETDANVLATYSDLTSQ